MYMNFVKKNIYISIKFVLLNFTFSNYVFCKKKSSFYCSWSGTAGRMACNFIVFVFFFFFFFNFSLPIICFCFILLIRVRGGVAFWFSRAVAFVYLIGTKSYVSWSPRLPLFLFVFIDAIYKQICNSTKYW